MKTKLVRMLLAISLLTMGLLFATPTPSFASDGRITIEEETDNNIEQGGPQAERCIKARKFEDKDGHGDKDSNEDWLSGWQFTLYRKENGDWVEKDTQTTDAYGYADFGGWPVGDEYKIVETRQDGWTCTNCTTAEAPFTLSECGCGCKEVKFGNCRDKGSITIVKEVYDYYNNDIEDDQDFDFTGDLGDFTLDDYTGSSTPKSKTFDNLAGTSYTVTEEEPTDWGVFDIVCTSDTTGGSTFTVALPAVTIQLDTGDDVTCTFKNAPPGPPTAVTLSSFATKPSAGGLTSPLWIGLSGLTVLAAGSLFWVKRRVG